MRTISEGVISGAAIMSAAWGQVWINISHLACGEARERASALVLVSRLRRRQMLRLLCVCVLSWADHYSGQARHKLTRAGNNCSAPANFAHHAAAPEPTKWEKGRARGERRCGSLITFIWWSDRKYYLWRCWHGALSAAAAPHTHTHTHFWRSLLIRKRQILAAAAGELRRFPLCTNPMVGADWADVE
jgi:hypothetical protein